MSGIITTAGDVTAANVATALAAATDEQAADMRESIDLQSTAIGFLDRFDYSTRYAENATLTHNSSLPEIGGNAYRIATNGATRPKIVSGALEPQTDSLDYFANQVTTTGGNFSLGLVVEFKRSTAHATAVNEGGFNVSISEQELVSSGASIGGISGTNPIHMTLLPTGISDAGFYLGASFTCLNATASGGILPWTPDGRTLPKGEKIAILFRVIGDVLEITAVGIGTLYFTHADISTKIGATTYFWFEPQGPDQGSDQRYFPRLYRWWAEAEELNTLPGYGMVGGEVSGGPHRFPGQVRLFPAGRTAKIGSDTLPGETTAALVATGTGTTAKGAYSRITGGAIVLESQLIQNLGYTEVGGSIPGWMIGAIDSNLNAPASSSATANAYLNAASFTILQGAENGDWQEWYWAGTLVGAGAKRIRINVAFGGGDPGTPGDLLDSNATGTPLDGVTGFFEMRLHRYTNSTASHTFYAHLDVNGVRTVSKRTAWNGTTNQVGGGVRTTTADAGGIVLDTFTQTIARVNIT